MPDIQQIIQRYNGLKSERDGQWLNRWREARKYCQPYKVDNLQPGDNGGDSTYDPTAIQANIKHASGIYAWMCPSDKRWFEIVPQDIELSNVDSVKWWYATASRILYDALNNSNWPLMFHESALNLGPTGAGVIYSEPGDRTLLNFLSMNIEKIVILEDKEQRVDTVFREFEYTARQCVQEFGFDQCSTEIQTAYKASDQTRREMKFPILHAVMPREDAGSRFGKLDNKEMPYASYWMDVKSKSLLLESGYWENPFAVYRYWKNDDSPYGYGPGMTNIQAIKLLNRYEVADIIGTEKAVRPPILIPENCLVDNTFRAYPDGQNFYKPNAANAKPEPFFDGANLPQLEKKILSAIEKVKSGFFEDMFDALGDNKNMSVPEVIERVESKIVPFAPICGRMQCELFGPVIQRCFGILFRRGAFPPPPPELIANPVYKIEYVSRISLAIKQLEAKGLMQTLNVLQPFIAEMPELLDHYNFNNITRGLSRNNGIPADWINPEKVVAEIRQNRAKAQQAQLAAQQMTEMAKAVPAAGKAPEQGSPLKMLMETAA